MQRNVNVAILGHIDSGKTALARRLTEISSTAALDKNPQSQERGITLDLGLSSFFVASESSQVTLVDCPGHAGLIRAVLGAAQIVDLALLVVDITKGIQTQTAECIVVAEVAIPRLIVVLNKIDQIDELARQKSINTAISKLRKTFAYTKFTANVPIVSLSALTGEGVETLKTLTVREIGNPMRPPPSDALVFLYDHCFALKGQGTVLTGTIVEGGMRVGDVVHIPPHGSRKVKSMQSFRQSVTAAYAGDRVGICVTNLDPSEMERGIVTKTPPPVINNALISCESIKYFKSEIKSKQKFHITLGHSTVLGEVHFLKSSVSSQYEYSEDFTQLALVQLEKPVEWPIGKLYLASKLDLDIHAPGCRLAFHGKILEITDENFRVFKLKEKRGIIEKSDDTRYIVKDLIKKDSDINRLIGNRITHVPSGTTGLIEGAFGKAGKLRVSFDVAGLEGEVVFNLTKILNL